MKRQGDASGEARGAVTDPQYVDRWIGLGRPTPLKIEHRVQLFACSVCAALVLDRDVHTAWHRIADA